MTTTETVERFFVTVTGGDGGSNEVWLEVDSDASPRDVLDALEVLTAPLTTCDLPRLTFDVDDRENPCPECKIGEVESVGREERDTGHQPYACNAGCGYCG